MARIFKSAVFQGVENSTTNVQVIAGVPPGSVITFAGVYNAAGDTLTSITIGGNAMTEVGKIAVNGGWVIGIAATTGNSFVTNPASGPFQKISSSATKYMLFGGQDLATTSSTLTAQCNIDSTGGNNALVMGSVLPSSNLTAGVANAPRYIRLDNGLSRGGDAIR